ncbi:MAG: fibronectin type III domain-containing protein, partial [Planctomycetia bacterium]|nr:fibronectin type III domain-containing protein [Planctomycetia bacterium]
MLAADGLRPLLEQASTLVMDASMGPNPVVMSKSQVVGTDVKSFVISHVPEGSVVEKWDALKEQWVDVSTMPKSSNPQELMRLLSSRYIKEGDKIQWRPKAGVGAAAQQAFQMIGWDDGSELLGVSAEAPSAVQNLAVSPTGVGELTVTWEAPATGDATSYSVTMTTTDGTGSTSSSVYTTTNTSYKVSGLSPANGYKFSVTASNADGTSSAA